MNFTHACLAVLLFALVAPGAAPPEAEWTPKINKRKNK